MLPAGQPAFTAAYGSAGFEIDKMMLVSEILRYIARFLTV